MNGKVARALGKRVGADQLTKQAAAVYTEIFEKIASKLGKRVGLNSMEIGELVKCAAMSKEAAKWWERMLAGGGAGAGVGAGLGLLGGPLAPLTSGAGALIGAPVGALGALLGGWGGGKDEDPMAKAMKAKQKAHTMATTGGTPELSPLYRIRERAREKEEAKAEEKRWRSRRRGRWGGGWRPDYSRFAAGPAGAGAGGAGRVAPELHGPEAERFWGRTGVQPQRMQAEQRALRDFAIGAQLRSQLGREFSRLSAQHLF